MGVLMRALGTRRTERGGGAVNLWRVWHRCRLSTPLAKILDTPLKLAYVCAVMGNKEVIGAYFDLLEETLTKNGLLDNPRAIFNVDETGMPLDHKPEKAIAKMGARNVTAHASGDKTNITVIACGSAAGQVIPQMVLFQGKKLNHTFTM